MKILNERVGFVCAWGYFQEPGGWDTCVLYNILYACWACLVESDSLQPHGLSPTGLFYPWNFPGNTGVGCHFLLQGSFSSQGVHISCISCLGRWMFYHSHSLTGLLLLLFWWQHGTWGILVPRSRIKPAPSALEAHGVLTTGPARKSQLLTYYKGYLGFPRSTSGKDCI